MFYFWFGVGEVGGCAVVFLTPQKHQTTAPGNQHLETRGAVRKKT